MPRMIRKLIKLKRKRRRRNKLKLNEFLILFLIMRILNDL